jgi:hypothetical protein
VKEIQKSFRVTCILPHKIVLLQVFSDYYERIVKFLPAELWYLDEENSASYILSGDVQPTVWDWIGVFKVLIFWMNLPLPACELKLQKCGIGSSM